MNNNTTVQSAIAIVRALSMASRQEYGSNAPFQAGRFEELVNDIKNNTQDLPTWRDEVASRVLPVLIEDDISLTAEEHAKEAYNYADALEEERRKRMER